jgi:DNA-binding NarL/FixJ family response regulator
LKTVLIIDDHDIVRFGLETLISSSPDLVLVGSVSNLADGLRRIAEVKPALVISDMSMDDSKGLDTVRAVIEAQGDRSTLIVSMHDEMLYGEQVLSLGAQGYLMKEHAHAQVVAAAQAVLNGQTWVSQKLNAKLLNRVMKRNATQRSSPDAAGTGALSMRELQVLELLGQGKTTKEIAFDLELSNRTVDIHRASIKRKLGLKSGAELMAFALSRT